MQIASAGDVQAQCVKRSWRRPPSHTRQWVRRWSGQVALHVVLLIVAVLALSPIVWLLTGSLQTIRELYDGVHLVPAVPQWQNYAIAWERGNLRTYLPNSLLYTASVVLCVVIASSMAGYALARIA